MKILSPEKQRPKFGAVCLAVTLLFFGNMLAQNPALKVFEQWNTNTGTQNFFQKSTTKTDGSGNIYVAGATVNTNGDYDILVAKYNSGGTQQWMNQYAGNAGRDDFATALSVDPFGNVFVTGSEVDNSTDTTDIIVIRYTPAGTQSWVQTYNAGYIDLGADVTSDPDGSVYVTGSTFQGMTTMFDVITVKYDSTGAQQWMEIYDHASLSDAGCRVMYNGGKIIVTGVAQINTTDYEAGVVTYSASSGGANAMNVSSTGGIGFAMVYGVATDPMKNVYVTGYTTNANTGIDYLTIKFDSTMAQVWTASYNGPDSLSDAATDIYLDSLNNVIVTGYSQTSGQGKDWVTIKYDSTGTHLWTEVYNGSAGGNDEAWSLVVNGLDKIYVTGYSFNGSSNDYHTIRYDQNGNSLWEIDFNGLTNGDDRAYDAAIDSTGALVIVGQSQYQPGSFEIVTVKYLEKMTILPMDTITATSNSFVYTENRGQLLRDNDSNATDIRYYTLHGSPNVFFSDTAVSYVYAERDTAIHPGDSTCRVDMRFKNSNTGKRIRAMNPRDERMNFYYSHIKPGRECVKNYDQLVSFNVWNNVDIIYGSNLRGMKYYFVCKPGGGGSSYSNIDLLYDGAQSITVNGSGALVIHTAAGDVVQPKASAWQLNSSGNFVALGWQPSYNLISSNEVTFSGIGSYNTTLPLIIAVDWGNVYPASILNLDWSTYYGGNTRDGFTDLEVSPVTGHIFATGFTLSSNFPTFLAAQPSSSGGLEAVAVKFDSIANRKYATYYGTSGAFPSNQNASAGALDSGDNFYIGGYSGNPILDNLNFPQSQPSGAYVDTTFNGGLDDCFFAKFSPIGLLLWATYYGGNNSSVGENVNEMEVDNAGNLYAVLQSNAQTPRLFKPVHIMTPLLQAV